MEHQFKICILAYGIMLDIVHNVLESVHFKDAEISCLECPVTQIKNTIRSLPQNAYDVFIARCANAAEFRRYSCAPMIEINIKDIDYLIAIRKALEIGKRPAIVLYNYRKQLDMLRLFELAGREIPQIIYENETDLKYAMLNSNYDVFVGCSYVSAMATAIGRKYVMLEVSTESIFSALNRAYALARDLRQEHLNNEISRTMLNAIPFGTIVFDEYGNIVHSNTYIQKYTGYSSSQLYHQFCDEYFPTLNITQFLSGNSPVSDAIRVINDARVRCILSKLTTHGHVTGVFAVLCSPNDMQRSITKVSYTDLKINWNQFITEEPEMQKLITAAKNHAKYSYPITITGEQGSGKRFLAKCIHSSSLRSNNQFIQLNMSSYIEPAFAKNLLGVKDNTEDIPGLLAQANDSTLCITNLHEVPFNVQSLISSAILENKIYPIGSTEPVPVNIRFILILPDLSKDTVSKIRPELYYRLTSAILHLPAIRERQADIPALFRHIFEKNMQLRASLPDNELIAKTLCAYSWPGNTHEMHAVSERLGVALQLSAKSSNRIKQQMLIDAIGEKILINDIISRYHMRDLSNTEQADLFVHGYAILNKVLHLSTAQIAQITDMSRTTLWRRLHKSEASVSDNDGL